MGGKVDEEGKRHLEEGTSSSKVRYICAKASRGAFGINVESNPSLSRPVCSYSEIEVCVELCEGEEIPENREGVGIH